jgi:hypothetical protein
MGLGSLSPRVNVEQSKKQAKDLLEAFREGDPKALDRIRWNHPRFRGLTDAEIRERRFVLADAQLVVARLHYFESWPKLLRHIDTLVRKDRRVGRFEDAADAIIAGDVAKLTALLRANPELVYQRSTRAHEAPLLHYVAANGVEDYRQVSPPNAVEVATVLLDAGAEPDATSNAYGGGWTALGLVATSTPPRQASVQIPLIELLLERGAAIDDERKGSGIVMHALNNGCPEAARALADRGARIPDVIAAVGVGRPDLVERLAAGASASELGIALHYAAGNADLAMIDLLIRLGAQLETRNEYGGTVLGQALWFAWHAGPHGIEDHVAAIDALIAAGARTDAYPEMLQHIEEVRRRAGSDRAPEGDPDRRGAFGRDDPRQAP